MTDIPRGVDMIHNMVEAECNVSVHEIPVITFLTNVK